MAQTLKRYAKPRPSDPRIYKVQKFLEGKGFLDTPQLYGCCGNISHRADFTLDDLIWVGYYILPIVLTQVPAVVLRFPRYFKPDPTRHRDLLEILKLLKQDADSGPSYKGVSYSTVKQWVTHPLRDGRLKPVALKRKSRTFRLHPETLSRLQAIAHAKTCTLTEALEKAVVSYPHGN